MTATICLPTISARQLIPDPPSPPQNLSAITSERTSSTVIEWEPPASEGDVIMYRITIQDTKYSEDETCPELKCRHTIVADGSDVMFNTIYDVEVTAISRCGLESIPAIIKVNVTG